MKKKREKSILILGGGLIGLSIAYELAKNNYQVEIISKNRAEAAGFVAAGMLATHAEGLEQELFEFGHQSQIIIPDWIKNIEIDSGIECGLKKCGIVVPFTSVAEIKKFPTHKYGKYLDKNNLQLEIKGLHPKWKHGLLFEQDGQIDNRRKLMRALERACTLHGVKFQEGAEVKELILDKANFAGVKIKNATGDVKKIFCKQAIVCCGAWSKKIYEKLPIFPIKGQMLSVQGPSNKLGRILFGPNTYLVPRDDGLIIVGATVEKAGFDKGNTPEGMKQLQQGIESLFPEATSWPHMEHWWGFRPSTPDKKPIIGKSTINNLFLATGHYRNGVLFSAISSKLIYKIIDHQKLSRKEEELIKKFSLTRFYKNKSFDSPLII